MEFRRVSEIFIQETAHFDKIVVEHDVKIRYKGTRWFNGIGWKWKFASLTECRLTNGYNDIYNNINNANPMAFKSKYTLTNLLTS